MRTKLSIGIHLYTKLNMMRQQFPINTVFLLEEALCNFGVMFLLTVANVEWKILFSKFNPSANVVSKAVNIKTYITVHIVAHRSAETR